MKKVLAILTKVRCHILRKGRMLMVALGLALLASGVLPVAGQEGSIGVTLRYPVKFVCGDPGGADVQLPLTRGRYHTAINIHNPSLDESVVFVKKVAVASA
jgi:hypothetical protein